MKRYEFIILSIFPEFFDTPLRIGVLGRAIKKGVIGVRIINIRDYTDDKAKKVDDTPYGGGSGMIMMAPPIVKAIEDIRSHTHLDRVILLSPQGRVFNQDTAKKFSLFSRIMLICGRYEGIDERVRSFVDEELSGGDFILSGGEPVALIFIDAISRLIPGVLGNQESLKEESFSSALLEYPQYTRPREFRGMKVPDILISGNHQEIRKWRKEQALKRTKIRRPDLLQKLALRKNG